MITLASVAISLTVGMLLMKYSHGFMYYTPDAETKKSMEDTFGYHTYQECIKFWSTPESLDSMNRSNPTLIPDDMCAYYRR